MGAQCGCWQRETEDDHAPKNSPNRPVSPQASKAKEPERCHGAVNLIRNAHNVIPVKNKDKDGSRLCTGEVYEARASSHAVTSFSGHLISRSNYAVTDDYDMEKIPIGEGAYGKVFLGREKKVLTPRGPSPSPTVRAIKSISVRQLPNIDAFTREVQMMARLSHPNVAKLFGTYADRIRVHLVMEYCSGGELLEMIQDAEDFTEKDTAGLMRQVFSVVNYLHNERIVHRDIKPENFLCLDNSPVHQCTLKLIDFGLATSCGPDKPSLSTICGTPTYMAPEIHTGSYNDLVDVWACGVLMYSFVCGESPWEGHDDDLIQSRAKKGSYNTDSHHWSILSSDSKDLLGRLIQVSTDDRLTAAQALEHDWVKHMAPRSANVSLSKNIVTALKTGTQSNNMLKQASLHIIARNWSEDKIKGLRDAFTELDINGDGRLSFEELSQGMKTSNGDADTIDIEAVWKNWGKNAEDEIDYEEFIAATLSQKEYDREEVCWAAFRQFDLDGNGKITVDELKQVLANAGAEDITALIKSIDEDGDGEIDFEEFLHMMQGKSGTTLLNAIRDTPRQTS